MFDVVIQYPLGDEVPFGSFPDSATAAAAVDQADMAGEWPEGANAVGLSEGKRFVLTGEEWEAI